MVSAVVVAFAKVTTVFPDTDIPPIVSVVGTPVTVGVPPLLNVITSKVPIIVLLGVQLAAVAQDAEPEVAVQTYEGAAVTV